MRPKFLIAAITFAIFVFLIACNSSSDNSAAKPDTGTSTAGASNEKAGIGKFQHVELTHPLDQKMVTAGKAVYDLKCASCHKLSDEKLVGPGWKGVTDRRTPEWIMNFVTNTEEMLQKNEAAKNLYEICLVKMPNQNLSDDDARATLEFQRSNDGKK